MAPNECIICLQKKTAKSGSGYENIVTCTTTASAKQLQKFGNECENPQIYAQFAPCVTTSDLIAKEFRYHRSCYKDLTRPNKDVVNKPDNEKRKECFNNLKTYIDKILSHGKLIRLTDLSTIFSKFQ